MFQKCCGNEAEETDDFISFRTEGYSTITVFAAVNIFNEALSRCWGCREPGIQEPFIVSLVNYELAIKHLWDLAANQLSPAQPLAAGVVMPLCLNNDKIRRYSPATVRSCVPRNYWMDKYRKIWLVPCERSDTSF